MPVLDFSTELENAEASVTLLKNDSNTYALRAIFKVFETNKGNTCGEVSFCYSYWWVDWTAQIFFKRNTTKDVFLIFFLKFHNSSFSNILSKMYDEIF